MEDNNSKSSTSCIVSGGGGFIGSHLLRSLAAKPKVRRIYVLDIKPPSIQDSKVQFVSWDIRHPFSKPLAEPCSVCFHLAALCKDPGYQWDEYFATNYLGTQHVCELAAKSGVERMVYTSTEMVFRASGQPMLEESLTAPDTAYGMSKLLGERVVQHWRAGQLGRTVRIVRPGVVFGQGENGNYTRLYNALRRRVFCYIGRPSTVKSSIYVKDLASFLLYLAHDGQEREIFNAAYPYALTIQEICNCMCDVFGWRRHIPVIPFHAALVCAYICEALNFCGMRNPVHHRRIEKLFYDTYIRADRMVDSGFSLTYDLKAALTEWKLECGPGGLC